MERRFLLQASTFSGAGAGKDAGVHGQTGATLWQAANHHNTAPDFYDDNLKGAFTALHFWLRAVASIRRRSIRVAHGPSGGILESGSVAGREQQIDLNVFYGSEDDWHRWLARAAS